jgi:hypothetical protein
MSDTVLVALIACGGSVLTAVTALLLNYRGFSSLERSIEVIEADLKQIMKILAEYDKRIERLEPRR